jgi:hypothetical protein
MNIEQSSLVYEILQMTKEQVGKRKEFSSVYIDDTI